MTEESNKSAGIRKKFATPPVKIACSSCRTSRTRCDGKKPCANCQARSRQCVYLPSRRGGARVRKKRRVGDESPERQPEPIPAEFEMVGVPQEPLMIENYINPGAGLSQLPDWFQDSDFMFDSLFTTPYFPDISDTEYESEARLPPVEKPTPMVRAYGSDSAILEAYYIFIHPFFPILPAPDGISTDDISPRYQNQAETFEDGFESPSPVGLAISAILALIPCPSDTGYMNQESVVFRRKYAQYLAQSVIESIEADSEIPDSSTEPQKALEELPNGPDREPFHRDVPLELEPIVAWNLLSVYEYSQRGNLKKMRSRAGQALVSAMALSLHCCTEDEEKSEIKRRIWWMTYMSVTQASIINNTKLAFAAFTPSFTAKFPTLKSDPEAFALLVQSQQAILTTSQFSLDLGKALAAGADMAPLYERMMELDSFLVPLIAQSDAWVLRSTPLSPVDPSEEVVSRSLRCMARIKLNSARIKVHRYCAFFDLPIFSGRHCDLKAKPTSSETDRESNGESNGASNCAYSPFIANPTTNSSSASQSTSSPFVSANSTPSSNGDLGPWSTMPGAGNAFPFTSHHSSKMCLQSALNVAQSFNDLPYTNPSGQQDELPCRLSPTSIIPAPRTMPSFACCAMQCAYALLMVRNRTKTAYAGDGSQPSLVASLLGVLRQGLESISATLENYSLASEALGGMRDQVRNAAEAAPAPFETCA